MASKLKKLRSTRTEVLKNQSLQFNKLKLKPVKITNLRFKKEHCTSIFIFEIIEVIKLYKVLKIFKDLKLILKPPNNFQDLAAWRDKARNKASSV